MSSLFTHLQSTLFAINHTPYGWFANVKFEPYKAISIGDSQRHITITPANAGYQLMINGITEKSDRGIVTLEQLLNDLKFRWGASKVIMDAANNLKEKMDAK